MCAVIGIVVAAVGVVAIGNAVRLAWLLVAGGAGLAVACYFLIRIVRQGGNPTWMRAPLDQHWNTSLRNRAVAVVLFVGATVTVLLTFVVIVRNLVM